MERRFYLGVGILAAVLVFGLLGGFWIGNANRQVVGYLEAAETAAGAGDTEQALELARRAEDLWDRQWRRVAVIVDHTSMDKIDSLFAQMEHYTQEGAALLGACCAQVRELITAISDGHQFTWWNLL